MENFDENLENEYRKRFENFDEMPDDFLWENIQARIKPEKERPFIIWWNTMRGPVGIAASLLIGLLIGAYFFVKTDNTTQIGDLPNKPNIDASQPKKPDVTQKVKPVDSNIVSADKTGNVVSSESKQVASAKGNTEKTTLRTKPSHNKNHPSLPRLVEEQEEFVFQKPVEKETENAEETKQAIAVNRTIPKVKTERPIVAEPKQSEEEKVVLARNAEVKAEEEAKAIAEEKANEIKLAVTPTPGQPVSTTTTLANEANQTSVLKDTLFQSIIALNRKEAQHLAVTAKQLQVPELPETEMPMVVEGERRRLVFIPPTEVFANVTSTLSYYMFSPNKGDQILVNNFSSTSQRLGFAAQLGFVYPLAKKMDLRTGLSYFSGKSRISYGVADDSQKSVTVLDNNSIQINPGNSTKNENRNWQYFEVQSDLLYEVRKMQALSLGMKFGVQTSVINKPLLQARLGYRVSKAIAQHWALWLEPNVSVSLSSHHSLGDLFMYRTTGFGLNMGVSLLR